MKMKQSEPKKLLTKEKNERMRSMMQELNGLISDKDDGRALTMCFLRKVEKWEEGSGFYKKSARKTKQSFDPR